MDLLFNNILSFEKQEYKLTGGTGPMPLLKGLIPGDVIEFPELKPPLNEKH